MNPSKKHVHFLYAESKKGCESTLPQFSNALCLRRLNINFGKSAMNISFKNVWCWLFSLNKREREVKDAAEKLHMSMRTTSKCRYNAAGRLLQHGKYSFFTTTVLSLGLVFIPLIQNAEVLLAFKSHVLNMMQIFLGVSVLVYSVVIGTARYDMRSSQLMECGDKLKELIRDLEKDREVAGGKISANQLEVYQKRYSDIVTDVENHERNDYRMAVLEMVNDYYICGIPRFKLYLEAHIIRIFGFILPTVLMLMEVVFITDMMGATKILTPYLNGQVVEGVYLYND